MENITYSPPRRIRLDLNSPAELSIYNSMQEIEKLSPDVRLTDAINLLSKARELVADYIDEQLNALTVAT